MKAQKRILSALLCAVLCSLNLFACSDDSPGTEAAPDARSSSDALPVQKEEPVEEEILPDLPETDFEGREFHVLGRDHPDYGQFTNFEIYAEEENGQAVNDAIFRRNLALEDRYHVKIAQSLFEEPEDILMTTTVAGDDLYDLVFLYLESCGTMAQSGYLYNLNTVEYIDFEKPWWNPDVNASLRVLDKLYYTSSDFSLRDKNRAYIQFYNAEMAEQYGMPDFVELARQGKWTLDAMYGFSEQAAGDLDGDGAVSAETDSFGLTMDSYNAFAAFTFACDNPIISMTDDGVMEIAMNTERMVETVNKVIKLTCNPNTAFFCEDLSGKVSFDHWYAFEYAFVEKRALFCSCFTHILSDMSEQCDFNYTVIPFPKFDEAQARYLTMPDIYSMLFGIPSVSSDPDFSGFMLEALSAASMTTTLPAYYDVTCKTKHSANPESAEMLDVIFDGITYDNSILFQNSISLYSIIAYDIPSAKENNFSSMYAGKQKVASKMMEKAMETFKGLDS